MPNRYICDVLREIKDCVKIGRIDMIKGLVQELQVMANRMEAKLADYANMGYDLDTAKDLHAQLRKLGDKAKAASEEFDRLNDE
jgi:hypothetical protein